MKLNKILTLIVCFMLLFITFSAIGIARVDNYSTPQSLSIDLPKPKYLNYNEEKDEYYSTPRLLQYGDAIDQYMTEFTDFGWLVYPFQWIAQGFTPNMSILTRVEIELFKIGKPPSDSEIYIGLWDDLDGEELASIIFTENDFPGTRKWFTFDFDDMFVDTNHTYYIICLSDVMSLDYGYCWFAVNDNPYPRGDAWISFFGLEWVLLDDPPDHPLNDCIFKTYGIDKTAMKFTFLRGRISNQTTIGDYRILNAGNIHGFQLFPFKRIHYKDNEKLTIHKRFLGLVNNNNVFGIFKAHI